MKWIRIERRPGAVEVILDHPSLNILTLEVMKELLETLHEIRSDDRVWIVRGARNHFSAGADVAEHLPDHGEELLKGVEHLFVSLEEVSVPTMAVVRGACLGAGMELAAACDWAITTEDATWGVPEVTLGVLPPVAAAILPERIGISRAMDVIFSGRTFLGKEAKEMGLALAAVSPERLEVTAREWEERLTRLSASALRGCKEALRRGRGGALMAACAVYRERVLHSSDGIEGLRAFLEKRVPLWSHR